MPAKPTMITANLTVVELKNPSTREKARICDRMPERRTTVKVDQERTRRAKVVENGKLTRQRLL